MKTPFTYLFRSELVGSPDELLVFGSILGHCDSGGISDITLALIEAETGLNASRVRKATEGLKTREMIKQYPEDLEKLWYVRNHEFFLYSREELRRRKQIREAQARYRAKLKKEAKAG